jgi:hypothetical protein
MCGICAAVVFVFGFLTDPQVNDVIAPCIFPSTLSCLDEWSDCTSHFLLQRPDKVRIVPWLEKITL